VSKQTITGLIIVARSSYHKSSEFLFQVSLLTRLVP